MSLLQRLVIDLKGRCASTLDSWHRLEPTLPPEAKTYAERIRGKLLERAATHLETILRDPDLLDPQFERSYYIDYKRIAELVQDIEEGALLALVRYGGADRLATLTVHRIVKEINYPDPPPLCSASSSQYYFAHTRLDLIFVPCLEPYRLLGLSDLYHELAHFLIGRYMTRFLQPIDAEIDRYFDQAVNDARSNGWVQPLIDELELFRRAWKREWMIEFVADMIATFCAGPAYGWANVRLCSNVSAELFEGASTHPADAARTTGIDVMLRGIGCAAEADEVESEWLELVRLTSQKASQAFGLAYPRALIEALAERTKVACLAIGLKPFGPGGTLVTDMLNEAWREFHAKPDEYGAWETGAVDKLREEFGLPATVLTGVGS